MSREYRKCPVCGEYRHDWMFPWLDSDATLEYPRRRTINPLPAATYAKRVAKAEAVRVQKGEEIYARRFAAQAKGRDYTKCLPCVNGDAE